MSGFTRLYLGRLAPEARREDIEDFFKGYGRINDVRVMNGFGFCEFENARDAEDVQKDFNGRSFMGDRIVVEAAKGPRRDREFVGRGPPGRDPYYGGAYGGYPDRGGYGGRGGYGDRGYGAPRQQQPRLRRGNYRVIVSNLPMGTSWQDLKDLGREAGQIAFADVSASRPEEGVLEYQNREDMERAVIKIDGVELRGNKLRVEADARASPPRESRDYRDRSPPPRDERRDDRDRSPLPSRRRDDSPPPRRRDDDDLDDRREPLPSRRYSASRSPPPRRERSYDDRSPRRDD